MRWIRDDAVAHLAGDRGDPVVGVLAGGAAYTVITFLLVVAIWRTTRLLVTDEFPPVKALREWVISTFASVDVTGALGRSKQWGVVGFSVAYVWTCAWCMSIWAGAGLVALASVWVSVPAPWLVVAAGSCVAGVMSWVEQEHDQRWAARDSLARERRR